VLVTKVAAPENLIHISGATPDDLWSNVLAWRAARLKKRRSQASFRERFSRSGIPSDLYEACGVFIGMKLVITMGPL
jgi:hypothetical protein